MALSLAGCDDSQEAATAAGTKAEIEQAAMDVSAKAENTAAEAETKAEGETTLEAAEGGGGGILIVGFDQDFPSAGFMGDNGEYTGLDLELAQEVARRLELEYKTRPIAWDFKDMELEVGNISCIWNGFTMTGHEDDYTWSEPYMANTQVFVVAEDSDVASQEDLANKIAECQMDPSAEAALKKVPDLTVTFKELLTMANYNSAFMDLERGVVDAIAIDVIMTRYQTQRRSADFVIPEDSLFTEEYGAGFKKGNTQLRDKVQATLEEVTVDDTLRPISGKRFDEDVTTIGRQQGPLSGPAVLPDNPAAVRLTATLYGINVKDRYEATGKTIIQQMLIQLAGGMGTNIQISLVTLMFSLPLGFLVIFGCISKNRLLRTTIKVYISIMRGTPLMLRLTMVYFGPYYLPRIRVGSGYWLWTVFIGSIISCAAYFVRIYRNGVQSMPVGQYETTQILGYSRFQTFLKIILPQVIKRILPSVTNEVVTLVKDTSLASTLSTAEILSIAKALAVPQTDMAPLVTAGLLYYILSLAVAVGMERVEKRMDYYRQEQEDYGL